MFDVFEELPGRSDATVGWCRHVDARAHRGEHDSLHDPELFTGADTAGAGDAAAALPPPPPPEEPATTTVRVTTWGGGGATGVYRTTTRPRSGISGIGAVAVVETIVVVGGSIANAGCGCSTTSVAAALVPIAINVVPHASEAPVHARILAQRVGKSLFRITARPRRSRRWRPSAWRSSR